MNFLRILQLDLLEILSTPEKRLKWRRIGCFLSFVVKKIFEGLLFENGRLHSHFWSDFLSSVARSILST